MREMPFGPDGNLANDALLARMLGELNCPVRVIHDPAAVVANEDCEDAEADGGNSNKNKDDKDTVDAGLVADGSDWTSLVGALSACGKQAQINGGNTAELSSGEPVLTEVSTDNMNFEFTKSDTEYGYDEADAVTIDEKNDTVEITKEGT